MKLAYEEDLLIGVFDDEAMAHQWLAQNEDIREIHEIPLLDKTFAQMSVEYNNKYEQ